MKIVLTIDKIKPNRRYFDGEDVEFYLSNFRDNGDEIEMDYICLSNRNRKGRTRGKKIWMMYYYFKFGR